MVKQLQVCFKEIQSFTQNALSDIYNLQTLSLSKVCNTIFVEKLTFEFYFVYQNENGHNYKENKEKINPLVI